MTGGASTRGVLAGIAAGVTFGFGAPLAKRLLAEIDPLPLASLLYLGAGVGLAVLGLARGGRAAASETALKREDVPTLAAMVVIGGIVGPLLMLIGLRHVPGVAGALLLNLEAPLTMLLAVVVFGEHLGGAALGGAVLVVAGATALSAGAGEWHGDARGVAAIAAACCAWAVDNNLAARLSLRDPLAVARWKTLGAGTFGAVLCAGLGYELPSFGVAAPAMVVGVVSYGISIVLAVRAARALGAARQAALFASAPFVGALGAVPILGESLGAREVAVGVTMALGLVLLWREHHAHVHTHEPLAHDHVHVHDEHHPHDHAGAVAEAHAHHHVHATITHAHPHRPDAHHRHRH